MSYSVSTINAIGTSLQGQCCKEFAKQGFRGQPIYIFDTSGIIDLCQTKNPGVFDFFKNLNGNSILIPEVFGESVLHHHCHRNGHTRDISSAVMGELCRLHDLNAAMVASLRQHSMYDTHRYTAYCLAMHLCNQKKTQDDVISETDTHILATALTMACHGQELGLQNAFPVVCASDAHIIVPLQAIDCPGQLVDRVPELEGDALSQYCNKVGILHPGRSR
jgi:hypothetical protein